MNTQQTNSERIVRQQTFDRNDTDILTSSLRVEHLPDELMVLYQLSLKLLGTTDPDLVIGSALERLRQRTDAAVVGFLWVNDDNVAVKGFMVSDDGKERQRILFNLTNYQPGPQPPESFELPAGAKPFSMPSFGGMAGMEGMQGAPGSQGNQSMPNMTEMKQMQQTQQYPQGVGGSEAVTDAAGAPVDPSDMSSDPGLAGDAKEAADQGVTQGVKEGVFEESKNAAKGLINKGFGLFKK